MGTLAKNGLTRLLQSLENNFHSKRLDPDFF